MVWFLNYLPVIKLCAILSKYMLFQSQNSYSDFRFVERRDCMEGTLFIGKYNVDIYDAWRGKQKLWQVNVMEFDGISLDSKPTGREQHIYMDSDYADIKTFCQKENNLKGLFDFPKNSILTLDCRRGI